MAKETMPEGGPPSEAVGSEPVTETVRLVEVVCAGSELTCWWAGSCPSARKSRVCQYRVAVLVLDAGSVDGQRVVAFVVVNPARPLI